MKIKPALYLLTAVATMVTVATGCGSTTTGGSSGSAGSLPNSASITVPKADRFEPFLVEVGQGATVTWTNRDTDPHTVVGMPTDPVDFKMVLMPGQSASYTFTQPGIYGYYCDAHSSYDPATGLIMARKGSDAYPISMYGIIMVGGGSLALQSGHANVVMPSADWFEPLAIAVKAGTHVTWSNLDSDAHTVVTDPGAPSQFTLVAPPHGAVSYTFDKAGIYAYYCSAHASWNAQLKRVQAAPTSDVYPAAMEGVVFVLP